MLSHIRTFPVSCVSWRWKKKRILISQTTLKRKRKKEYVTSVHTETNGAQGRKGETWCLNLQINKMLSYCCEFCINTLFMKSDIAGKLEGYLSSCLPSPTAELHRSLCLLSFAARLRWCDISVRAGNYVTADSSHRASPSSRPPFGKQKKGR